ncbi:spermatogenesis-associated protein 21 isoform X3 [Panthera uncia]|uniref:spermatogenesis-associated protein 21 isoform X3 n=1 Tax=Panthera uncia TaxID=29064 RepID=UPI0020FFEDAF|nr:spermatogenesis-associated protein 21 isoform X3 [Panthera uncia]
MDNGNAQMHTEGRIKAPGAQPSPGMSTTSKRPGVEPTVSEISQVAFPDAAGMGSGKQPSSAPGGPEKGPEPSAASEEGPRELRTQEQRQPAEPGKKPSTPAPQQGPRLRQGGRDQAKPGSELGVLPSRVPAAQEGQQQQGSGKETKDQQGRHQNPGMVEGQAPESHQDPEWRPPPGHQAANGEDRVQPVKASCTSDSRGQQLGDKPAEEVDTPRIRPQGALPEPGPGGHEDSSQGAGPRMPPATLEEKTANSFPPPTPGPDPPKRRGRGGGDPANTRACSSTRDEGHWREEGPGSRAEAASGAHGGRRGPEPQEPSARLHEVLAGGGRGGGHTSEGDGQGPGPAKPEVPQDPDPCAHLSPQPASDPASDPRAGPCDGPILGPVASPRVNPRPWGHPGPRARGGPAAPHPGRGLEKDRTPAPERRQEPEQLQGTAGAGGARPPQAVSDPGGEDGGDPHPEAGGSLPQLL